MCSFSTDGLAMFKSFLKSEFSEENVEFWVACEDFKKTKSPMKMGIKAKKIYEDFIQSEGPREVRRNPVHFNHSDFLHSFAFHLPGTCRVLKYLPNSINRSVSH